MSPERSPQRGVGDRPSHAPARSDGPVSTGALIMRVWGEAPDDVDVLLRGADAGDAFLVTRVGPGGPFRVLPLPDADGRVTVGRETGNDIVMRWDPYVSRSHAVLDRLAGVWVVRDDGRSRHGTYLNDAWVRGEARLEDGDMLALGQTRVLFRDLARARGVDGALRVAAAGGSVRVTDTRRRVLVELARPLFASPPQPAPASNQDIADTLVVTVGAVKKHLRQLVREFGITDVPDVEKRSRLVREAQAWGLIGLRDFRPGRP